MQIRATVNSIKAGSGTKKAPASCCHETPRRKTRNIKVKVIADAMPPTNAIQTFESPTSLAYQMKPSGLIAVDAGKTRAIESNKPMASRLEQSRYVLSISVSRLTIKAEPPPTRDVNRDSGTDRANGGWLRRLVRQHHRNLASCMTNNVPKYP